MATTTDKIPHRERRPSVGAPIVDIQGSVGPAGISRPKHKRTLTGFGAAEIQNVEGMLAVPSCTWIWRGLRVSRAPRSSRG